MATTEQHRELTMPQQPKVSLILVTLGRTVELERFLKHLDGQSYKEFELIVVDQNPDERVQTILDCFERRFTIIRLRSQRGLSRGRNVGLKHATGEIMAFPDDDCWYPPNAIGRALELFASNPECSGITGRSVTNLSGTGYKFFDRTSGHVNKNNVWRRSTSYTIFLKATVVHQVGAFDEALGVGSDSGRIAAEEVDYLIRALELGFKIAYYADFWIFHPMLEGVSSEALARRGYGYSLGVGHVLRKHNYALWVVGQFWLRALAGVLIALLACNIPDAKYHLCVFRGRVMGWLT